MSVLLAPLGGGAGAPSGRDEAGPVCRESFHASPGQHGIEDPYPGPSPTAEEQT